MLKCCKNLVKSLTFSSRDFFLAFSTLHEVIRPLLAPTRTRCFLVVQTSTSMFEVVPRIRIINGSSPFSTLQTAAMIAPFRSWSSRYLLDLLLHHGVFGDMERVLRMPSGPSNRQEPHREFEAMLTDEKQSLEAEQTSLLDPFDAAEVVFANSVRRALHRAYLRAAEWDRVVPDRRGRVGGGHNITSIKTEDSTGPTEGNLQYAGQEDCWFSATWLRFSAFGMCVWCFVGVVSCFTG